MYGGRVSKRMLRSTEVHGEQRHSDRLSRGLKIFSRDNTLLDELVEGDIHPPKSRYVLVDMDWARLDCSAVLNVQSL